MKKFTLFLLIILALTLTACGASGTTPQSGSTTQGDPTTAPLTLVDQLVIGTLKLDGTSNTVTAQQATDLLPLWQVYKDLSTSDNAAQPEIDALVQQIQDALTPEQMQAITDMKLTREDMFATMQELGIQMGLPTGSNGTVTPGQGGGFSGGGGDFPGGGPGGPPGGGPGPGGGGPPDGQSFTPEQMATAQARRAQGGGFNSNRIPPALFDALIQYLHKIANS
jgi:hypothetical protein